jgi:uncharacterized membrane protein HdeD (DUF308 family)
VNATNALGGRKENDNWWLLLLAGLAGIVVGVLTFVNPTLTALALVFYIAIWAIASGLVEIIGAIRLRKEIAGEIWMIFAGILTVAFGVFLIARPSRGALALLMLIGIYGVVSGTIFVILAFRARSFFRHVTAQHVA